jgi:ABC-type cobalamin/Fe3+-siderophores transport systems, ATPase components
MNGKGTRIKLRDLTIGYSSKKTENIVAKSIFADICGGELTGLFGANGVGKSTLLRTLSAFQPSLSGDIIIQGKTLKEYTEKELSLMIGLVLTEKIDGRNMSVRELVSLGRSPHTGFWGNLSSEDCRIVEEAIYLVKIDNLADRQIYTLSDGERQKVMIAKALAQQTPIILLDEPTAFLDFQSKVEILRLLHQLSKEADKTIFLSTHDVELFLQIADKIWLMDKEHGIRIGSPDELATDGTLSAFFSHKDIQFDAANKSFRVRF